MPSQPPPVSRPIRHAAAVAVRATFNAGLRALAGATLLGVAVSWIRPGSALHPHWLGTTGSSELDATVATAFGVAALLGVSRSRPRPVRLAAAAVLGLAIVLAGTALVRHAAALVRGDLHAAGWAPPTTLLALVLLVPAFLGALRAPASAPPRAPGAPHLPPTGRRSPLRPALATAAAGVALVLGHLSAVGATDYRAPADAILVLGSRVHGDGRPSGSLIDRTRTAAELWREGLAPVVILSGGHGADAPISEPEAMRTLALEAGVPASALVLDEAGVDTAASIRFAARLARERGWRRVLVVSHDYHLARVRLLADREGLTVRTVPAVETRGRLWKCTAIPREVLAWGAAWAWPTR